MSRLLLIGAASAAALALAACGDKTDTASTTTTDTTTAATTTPDTTVADNSATPAAPGAPAGDAMAEGAQFVNMLGQANLAEIQTSEMALTKAKNADVKKFAQKMIDDHKAAGDKLKTLTSANNMPAPPMALDDMHKRRIDDLTETDGDADFDADYISAQVDMHKDTLDLVKDYADKQDAAPELKAFAMELLPQLQMHHEMAEKLRDTVKKST